MDNRIQNPQIAQFVNGVSPVAPQSAPATTQAPAANDFKAILADRLKLSGHAQTRLQSRQIEMSSDDWNRVLGGIDKAAAKGAKESLVMCDDKALVVSVKNRTVITAVDKNSLKDNVFTNIDSAVVV